MLVARLLGRRTGLIAGVLLAVEPFVVAHTVVLHTDGILALTVTASGLAPREWPFGLGDAGLTTPSAPGASHPRWAVQRRRGNGLGWPC